MLGNLSSVEGLKLICDVSESIKRELDILVVKPLEAVEEIVKHINSRVTSSGNSLIDLGEPILDQL